MENEQRIPVIPVSQRMPHREPVIRAGQQLHVVVSDQPVEPVACPELLKQLVDRRPTPHYVHQSEALQFFYVAVENQAVPTGEVVRSENLREQLRVPGKVICPPAITHVQIAEDHEPIAAS
jgi:hypothetical protein